MLDNSIRNLVRGVMITAFLLVVTTWSTLGLIIYLSTLLRSTVVLAFTATISLIEGANIQTRVKNFEAIATSWPYGLRALFDIFILEKNENTDIQTKSQLTLNEILIKAVEEMVFIGFYIFLYFLIFDNSNLVEWYQSIQLSN